MGVWTRYIIRAYTTTGKALHQSGEASWFDYDRGLRLSWKRSAFRDTGSFRGIRRKLKFKALIDRNDT